MIELDRSVQRKSRISNKSARVMVTNIFIVKA